MVGQIILQAIICIFIVSFLLSGLFCLFPKVYGITQTVYDFLYEHIPDYIATFLTIFVVIFAFLCLMLIFIPLVILGILVLSEVIW